MDEDILGFDVPMGDSLLVQFLEGSKYLANDFNGCSLRELFIIFLDVLPEVSVFAKFSDDIEIRLGCVVVNVAENIRALASFQCFDFIRDEVLQLRNLLLL